MPTRPPRQIFANHVRSRVPRFSYSLPSPLYAHASEHARVFRSMLTWVVFTSRVVFVSRAKTRRTALTREVKEERQHPPEADRRAALSPFRAPDERATMATIEVTFPSDGLPGKILKWRVRSDTMVAAGRVLLLYQSATPPADDEEEAKESERKLRATNFGRVKQLLAKEGDVIQPGYASLPLFSLEVRLPSAVVPRKLQGSRFAFFFILRMNTRVSCCPTLDLGINS